MDVNSILAWFSYFATILITLFQGGIDILIYFLTI